MIVPRCAQCGYELAGSQSDGSCPECSFAIADSQARFDDLERAAPIARLLRVCAWLRVADALCFVTALTVTIIRTVGINADSDVFAYTSLSGAVVPAIVTAFVAAWSSCGPRRPLLLALAAPGAATLLWLFVITAQGVRGVRSDEAVFAVFGGRSLALLAASLPLAWFARSMRFVGRFSLVACATAGWEFASVSAMFLTVVASRHRQPSDGVMTFIVGSWLISTIISMLVRQIAIVKTLRAARSLRCDPRGASAPVPSV